MRGLELRSTTQSLFHPLSTVDGHPGPVLVDGDDEWAAGRGPWTKTVRRTVARGAGVLGSCTSSSLGPLGLQGREWGVVGGSGRVREGRPRGWGRVPGAAPRAVWGPSTQPPPGSDHPASDTTGRSRRSELGGVSCRSGSGGPLFGDPTCPPRVRSCQDRGETRVREGVSWTTDCGMSEEESTSSVPGKIRSLWTVPGQGERWVLEPKSRGFS